MKARVPGVRTPPIFGDFLPNYWLKTPLQVILTTFGFSEPHYVHHGHMHRGYMYCGCMYCGYMHHGHMHRGYMHHGYMHHGYNLWIQQSESRIHASWTHLHGSHSLSARRARRTKSSRPEGPKANPKGHQLEDGARRAPKLLVLHKNGGH